jgi:serine/threonine protein kinase
MHRDLKTQNIFLTKSDIVKVGDLGIARVLESSSDMATTLIGTPYYMSPELFANRPYNQKSDVWALGCVVYEMATLKHAFDARDMNGLVYKIIRGKIPPMPKNYSPELCDMIRSMLSQAPARRPSITRLLKTEFIKSHIRLFLEESKRKKSSKSRRRGSDSDHAAISRERESPQLPRDMGKEEQSSIAVNIEAENLMRRGSSVRSSTDSNSSCNEQTTTAVSKRPLPPTPPHVAGLKDKSSITGSEKPFTGENLKLHTSSQSPHPTNVEQPEVISKKDSSSSQTGAQYNKAARAKRREKSQVQQSPKAGQKCPVQSDFIVKVESAASNVEDELEQTFVVHESVEALTGPDVNADEQMLCTIMDTCTIAPTEDDHSASRHSVFLSDSEDEDEDKPQPQEVTVSGSPTGRLFDRVQKLKSDCLRGLGKDILQQCLGILADETDSDSAEVQDFS